MTFRPRDARRNPVILGLLFALALVAGCSKKDKVDPPAELTTLRETIKVQKAWSASVGGSAPKLRLGLGVAVEDLLALGHEVLAQA